MTHEAEQRFPAAGINRVVIDAHHGDLTVGWQAGDDLVVHGEGVTLHHDGDELVVERAGHRGGRLVVLLPAALPGCVVSAHRGNLELENARGRVKAQVERGNLRLRGGQAEVVLRTGSGNAAVDDLTGPATVLTGAGDLRLTRVDGPVEARTGSGNISVRDGAGSLDGRTGSGNISVDGRAGDRFALATGSGNVAIGGGRSGATEVITGSGNILCTAVLGLAAHTFNTNSGNISVAVPRGLAARIEAATTLGSIRSDLPLVSVGQRGPKSLFGRRLVGSLGDGPDRAEITLRTARGDIRLGWLDAAVPPAPGDAAAPAARATHERLASDLPVPPAPPVPPGAAAPGERATHKWRADDLPVPPVPPVPPAATAAPAPPPAAPEAAQRHVLEALAAGQISVAEAERLLAALDEQTAAEPGDR
jgi:hypothetical protein